MTRCVLALLLVAAPAAAQVDEGREALASAEFERAIRAFDAAERGPLDRAQYVALLEGRALAAWASGDADRARADLSALAAIDPAHVLPAEAPPDLTELFAERAAARAGPSEARAAVSSAGDSLEVTVENDDLGLVRRVRAHVRAGDAEWSIAEADPPEASFPLAGSGRAEAWVELVGPGGAVLGTAGSAARPLVWIDGERAVAPTPREVTRGDDTALWIGLGAAGAAVVIAIVIVVAVAASSQGPAGTQPDAPIVVGF